MPPIPTGGGPSGGGALAKLGTPSEQIERRRAMCGCRPVERCLQTLFQGADHQPADQAGVAKAHLRLRRMHIDIDLARFAVEKQNKCRMPPLRHIIHVSRAHRANEQLVADRPPVDKEILRLRIGFVPGRQASIAFKAKAFPRRFDRKRIGAEFLAQNIGEARQPGLFAIAPGGKIEARRLRAREGEAHAGYAPSRGAARCRHRRAPPRGRF